MRFKVLVGSDEWGWCIWMGLKSFGYGSRGVVRFGGFCFRKGDRENGERLLEGKSLRRGGGKLDIGKIDRVNKCTS